MSKTTRIKLALVALFISTSIAFSHDAHAGIIVKSPAYLGLNKGLVGCWSFDGSYTKVPDCSGNNNTGTLTGGPKKVQGKIGQALKFDGVDDRVDVPSITITAAFTMAGWVYVDGDGGLYSIILSDSTEIRFFGLNSSDVLVFVDGVADRTFGSALTTGRWYHVAVTSTGAILRAYIDGVLQTESYSVGYGSVTDTWVIGGDNGASDRINGKIDELRMYNRNLSASEISRLYRIGLGSTANRGASASPLDKGLVGHWTFDGPDISGTRAKDRSGFNNHGTLTNGPIQKIGKIGQALKFDGVDDLVQVEDQPVLDITSPMTVMAWIKRSNISNSIVGVVSKDSSNGCNPSIPYLLNLASNNTIQFFLGGNPGSCSGDENVAEGVTPIEDKNWHHIIGTINGSNLMSVYLDGVLDGTFNFIGTRATSNQPLYIGSNTSGAGSQVFFGSIDDVRVYNRALSAGEISRLYNQTQSKYNSSQSSGSIDKDLVGHWTFDGPDISGTRAKDSSGNGNHGTLTGGPTRAIGKIGQALSFDGVDDRVPTADINVTDGASRLTVSAWINRKGTTGVDHSFISKWTAWAFYVSPSNVVIFDTGVAGGGINGSTGGIHSLNTWEYWVAVFDGTQTGDTNRLKIYKDGVNQSLTYNGTVPATVGSTGNDLTIGDDPTGGFYFNGLIDEVRVYNRVLSASEVNKLYQMGR